MSHNEFVIRRKEVEMAHAYVTQDMFFLRKINLQYAVIEASISDNAKVFYMLLWKKAMEEKTYENGKLYVIARIIDTAVEMGKSSSSVKRAFRELEQVQGCNLCRDSKGQSSFGGLRAAALPGPGWAPGQVQSETLAQ